MSNAIATPEETKVTEYINDYEYTEKEARELVTIESEMSQIKNQMERVNFEGSMKLGRHLNEIYEKGLYAKQYGADNFAKYCRDKWGFEQRYARNLRLASMVLSLLNSGTGVPHFTAEKQVRPLTEVLTRYAQPAEDNGQKRTYSANALKKAKKDLKEVAKLIERDVKTGKNITQKLVKSCVDEYLESISVEEMETVTKNFEKDDAKEVQAKAINEEPRRIKKNRKTVAEIQAEFEAQQKKHEEEMKPYEDRTEEGLNEIDKVFDDTEIPDDWRYHCDKLKEIIIRENKKGWRDRNPGAFFKVMDEAKKLIEWT